MLAIGMISVDELFVWSVEVPDQDKEKAMIALKEENGERPERILIIHQDKVVVDFQTY